MTYPIPFEVLVTGHIVCEVSVAGHRLLMVIDTGASNTLISTESAERMHLALTSTEETATGAGGTDLEIQLAENLKLEHKGQILIPEMTIAVMDISNIRDAVLAMDGIEIDGVLGADLFLSMSAIIDYEHHTLVLREMV